jgi:DNA primase
MGSFVNFAELKQRVSIEQVAMSLPVKWEMSTNQLRATCPIHGGERGLIVTPAKQLFICMADNRKGGDAIQLVAHITGCTVNEAAHQIEKRFGTVTVDSNSSTVSNNRATAPQKEKGRPNAPAFDPEQYAARLDPAHTSLAALNFSPETLKAFKSGYAATGSNRGRLALAVHDRDGKIAGFIGRAIGPETPKLVFPNGFRPETYIFNAHRVAEGELYLVRDPLEVLSVYESGVENVVAFLTEGICAQQLEELASLMDTRHCELVHLY